MWVLVWILVDIKDKTRNAPNLVTGLKRLNISYWGMHIAHIGILLTAFGIGVTTSTSVEKDLAMKKGETVQVEGYDFKLVEFKQVRGANYDATRGIVEVSKNGQFVTNLYPEKRHYVVTQMPMTEASIQYNPLRDVYMALGEPIIEGKQTEFTTDKWAVRIYVKPMVRWVWWGSFVLVLGGVLSVLDKRYRKAGRNKLLSITDKFTGEQGA